MGTYRNDGQTVVHSAIPVSSRPLGRGYFLDIDGTLYSWEGSGKIIATKVTSAATYEDREQATRRFVDFTVKGLSFSYRDGFSEPQSYSPLVPLDVQAIGGSFFLTSDKRIISGPNGEVRGNEIYSATGYTGVSHYWASYVMNPSCK